MLISSWCIGRWSGKILRHSISGPSKLVMTNTEGDRVIQETRFMKTFLLLEPAVKNSTMVSASSRALNFSLFLLPLPTVTSIAASSLSKTSDASDENVWSSSDQRCSWCDLAAIFGEQKYWRLSLTNLFLMCFHMMQTSGKKLEVCDCLVKPYNTAVAVPARRWFILAVMGG